MKKPVPKKPARRQSRFVEDGSAGAPFKIIKKGKPVARKPKPPKGK